jgi:competence protein ComGC
MNIEQIAQSNIFFFVTTIAVVILSVLLAVVLVLLIRILKNIKEVSETVKSEGKNIVEDIAGFRSSLKEKGKSMSGLATLLAGAAFIKKKATKKKKTDV